MNQPPAGTVTFLFTDIEGSTKLWQQYPEAMNEALSCHHDLLKKSIVDHGGYVFQIIGDAFCAAFSTANEGLDAALDAQRSLVNQQWGETGAIKVRMALHTGRAEVRVGEYTSGEYISGLTLSRAARLLSAGHGGQILVSLATAELVRDHLPKETTLRDLGARRLKDLIRPEQIFQVVTTDLPVEFAPLKTLDVHPHNLPVQLTSFIGRELEMVKIKKLLSTAHLLTLTGIGGTGKTRLALQVSADLIDEFPGGVWLVELGSLPDPALVEQTVATVLGVHASPGSKLSDMLVDYVREKHLLLILDNCEHVVDACAQLTELLLRNAPGLKILVTSRVRLNTAGEMNCPVPPLALPDLALSITALSLGQYEAVRLFIERATAVQPAFSVTNENAPAVAQICTQLDGIPLAIELAAARIRLLSPDQISARLGDRFNLLTGGSRTTLPRHQTLRAAMDWSYDLLEEAERTLFYRLAVFPGSFSLEAVEAICTVEIDNPLPGSRLHPSQVLDLLGSLVDHSLVSVCEINAETRYVLLETVRQYTLEKLQASGKLQDVKDAHLAYYLILAMQGESSAYIGKPDTMMRFETEFDNFRAAMEHALATNLESGILLENSLAMFIDITARGREAYAWSMRILAMTETWHPGKMRAKALELAGWYTDQNDYQQGHDLLEASLKMAKELGDKKQIKNTLQSLQALNYYQKNWGLLEYYAEQHLAIARELDDNIGIPDALWALGEAISHKGDNHSGRMYLEQSLEISRQENIPNGTAFALHSLARLARLEGENAKAIVLYAECAQIRRQIGHRAGLANTLINLGQVYLQENDSIQAKAAFEESLALHQELKMISMQARCLAGFACIAGIDGQDETAARLLGAFESATERFGLQQDDFDHQAYDPIITIVHERLGETNFNMDRAEGRKMNLEQAIEFARHRPGK